MPGGGEPLEQPSTDRRIHAAPWSRTCATHPAIADFQLDASAFRRVLYRVSQQVLERTPEPDGVPPHRRGRAARSSTRTLRAAAVGPCASTASRATAQRSTDGPSARCHGLEAGQREQVLGELLQLVGALANPQREAAAVSG